MTKMNELLCLGREMKKLSLRAVEQKVKISGAQLCRYENGACDPSFRNAVKLCDLYGIKIERLAKTVRG